jgi:alkyldihydroxyacetonephosphate synthase
MVDNNQFQFGMALKTAPKTKRDEFIDKIKKYYVTEFKKYDPNKMVLCTLLFEGSDVEVEIQ